MGADDVVVADVERFEDGLVDDAADGVVGLQVELADVLTENRQADVEGVLDVFVTDAQAFEDALGALAFALQLREFLLEELA